MKTIIMPLMLICSSNLLAQTNYYTETKVINEADYAYHCKHTSIGYILLHDKENKLTYNDLFDMDDETYGTRSNFRIVFVKGLTHWVFGFGLIKNNKIAFDNEHQMIGFSTESQAYRINTIFPHIIEGREMFPKYKWINSSILICGIIFCFFVKDRIKKNIIY